jgi:hypothetical protein
MARPSTPLDVGAAIETTRFMGTDPGTDASGGDLAPISVAPGGTRYVTRLVRGDVERNGVWLDVVVGRLDSFATADKVLVICHLFTHGYERYPISRSLLDESFNPVVWLDERHVAFRWEDGKQIAQIVSLDVDTGELRFLTTQSTDVEYFAVSPRGKIIFVAAAAETDKPIVAVGPFGGTIVMSADGFQLADGMLGSNGLLDRLYGREGFVLDPRTAKVVKLNIRLKDLAAMFYFQPIWSPSERYVVIDGTAEKPPSSWLRYVKEHDEHLLDLQIRGALDDPDSWFGRQLNQLHVVDTETGSVVALWDAPTRPTPFRDGSLVGAWSPDERNLVVSSTYLPLDAEPDPNGSTTLATAVVDIKTGQVHRLPISGEQDQVNGFVWEPDGSIVASTRTSKLRFTWNNSQWRLASRSAPASRNPRTRVHLRIKDDITTPPRLYAIDESSRHEKLVLDPNPDFLNHFTLGRVSKMTWSDDQNRPAAGLLYYPVDYEPGKRYPLVIQVISPAWHLDHFNLYGASFGLGPSQSIYAAQPLANRGIAVLSVARASTGKSEEEVDRNIRMLEAAIRRLDAEGVIDAARVGLVGESRPGWLVTQAITHADFVYSAAIASDAVDTGYVAGTLLPGFVDRENGGRPFGATLQKWLERSAGFNADRIRTPLLLEDESLPGAAQLMQWELFSRLRSLKLPVEYYVIPDIERGSHVLQNPSQLMATKQGAIDWLSFWLSGDEDSDLTKADQYARWHRLRDQRDTASKSPRPPQFKWTATPAAARN